MHTFRVWAPSAKKVGVQVDGLRVTMEASKDDGWWRAEVSGCGPWSDYGFLVNDDEKVYPDPRSLWQPGGVHGLSRVYDHCAFAWSDEGFKAAPLGSAIVYELHVGTFTREGTLDAAIEKLEALKDLGITHVELMPVASFPGDYGWGYDGVALFAVNENYGGPDALKRFVNATHRRGMAVLLDVVYNHFGPSGNYTGKFGPYVNAEVRTPWGEAVNLDGAWSHEVRRFFCDNATMWMREFHMDGLRLDAVHALMDRTAFHFLEQLALETKALEAELGRPLVLIAESDSNDPRVVTERDQGGYGIDAQWSDDFHWALYALLAREKQGGHYSDFGSMKQLAKAMEETFVFDGAYSHYRRRTHGKPAKHLPQNRFLGYIQNHDQVGNRAAGERFPEVAGFDRAKVAAAIVFMSPFIPMIFMGEEWAASAPFQYFASHQNAELARRVAEGRKKELKKFGWDLERMPDPEERETFERSKLDWDEAGTGRHAEMLAWYRELIALRRSTPELNDGGPGHARAACGGEPGWISIERGNTRLLCNLGAEAHAFPLGEGERVLLSSRETIEMLEGVLKVPPDTAVIVRCGVRSDG